jgi:hypothetical protein
VSIVTCVQHLLIASTMTTGPLLSLRCSLECAGKEQVKRRDKMLSASLAPSKRAAC